MWPMSNSLQSSPELKIYRASVRKSPFVGVYCAVFGDRAIVSPVVPLSFRRKLSTLMGVQVTVTTIASVSSVGMMIAMNNRGVVVPRTIGDDELAEIERCSKVLVLEDRPTALGNLMIANDRACVVSDLISADAARQVSDFLGVNCVRMSVGEYRTIGSLVAVSNRAGVASPLVDERSIERISDSLQIQVIPTTINDGERLVKLGTLLNDRAIIVGKTTSGIELMSLQALAQ